MIQRYGGLKFWAFIADNFHEKLRSDSILRPFFERRTDAEASMINFNIFRAGFGEELPFYEQAVKEAHMDRGITTEHMNRFLAILRSVLLDEGVDDEDVQLIISRIAVYGDMIAEIIEE